MSNVTEEKTANKTVICLLDSNRLIRKKSRMPGRKGALSRRLCDMSDEKRMLITRVPRKTRTAVRRGTRKILVSREEWIEAKTPNAARMSKDMLD